MFVNASNYVPEDVFKVRLLLVESLVIVIFYVIFFMCYVVIINYCGKKLFQLRENMG